MDYTKERHQELHRKVVLFLGGKCIRCSETDIRVLQVNHKNGKGVKDFKRYGAYSVYRAILAGKRPKEDFDVRCANCNILYEYETGRRKVY